MQFPDNFVSVPILCPYLSIEQTSILHTIIPKPSRNALLNAIFRLGDQTKDQIIPLTIRQMIYDEALPNANYLLLKYHHAANKC